MIFNIFKHFITGFKKTTVPVLSESPISLRGAKGSPVVDNSVGTTHLGGV